MQAAPIFFEITISVVEKDLTLKNCASPILCNFGACQFFELNSCHLVRLRCWAQGPSSLGTKLRSDAFEKRFNNFEIDMSNVHKGLNLDISNLREICDRIRKKNEDNVKKLNETRAELELKMSQKEGMKIWANFKKYAQYEELKDLYRRCLPTISGFEDKLKEYWTEQQKMQLMMRRFDEVLCEKAEKTVLREFINEARRTYITIEDNTETQNAMNTQMTEFKGKVETTEETVKFQARQIQKEMYSAVRRVVAQSQGGKDDAANVSMKNVTEQLKEVVSTKAERDEMDTLISTKASKVDTEMCLRWVDLLHKMVNQVMLLVTLKCKSDLEPIGGESNNVKQNRKVQLLHQSLLISKWIESFDSQNINDFYFQTNREKNPEMIREVQLQFKKAISEIECTQLSPNLKQINQQLQEVKSKLNLAKKEDPFNETHLVHGFSAFSPSKRLKLNPSKEKFEIHNSDQIMAETQGRYNSFAKTARDRHAQSHLKGKNPPKLSPRATNRSVDPIQRSNYLMGKTSPSGEKKAWGQSGSLNFGNKKQSMPVESTLREMNVYQGLTSKYSFNVDTDIGFQKDNLASKTSRKNTNKTLKFKEESPSISRNNSGELSPSQKQLGVMKANLNDSSSKNFNFHARKVSTNDTGNFGRSQQIEDEAVDPRSRNAVGLMGTTSTLPNIKNFYNQ